MKSIKIIYPVILLLIIVSCEKIVMHPNPEIDNLSIFDEYAKICTEKFGLEEVKGINLSELADSLRPMISDDLSKEELFELMGMFVDRMQEGHTSLKEIDFSLNKSYYWFTGYPTAINKPIVDKYYFGEEANPDVQVIAPDDSYYEIYYGLLPQDNQIGYIQMNSFMMTVTDAELDTMMAYLNDAKGIIIDVRSNIGGFIDLAARLSSYFTQNEVIIGTNFIKNGPGKNDFAASEMKIKPSGSSYAFYKPVVILHDRVTFSSGSIFCVMMNAMENTTSIGVRFGGGTGDIMDGILANGWHWVLSTSNLVDTQGRPTDPGIEADIPMSINPADTITDALIERAIIELK